MEAADAVRPGLSVAVITLNEERNLRRCLESVGSMAGEIVVVDSGSTDGTVGLADELGARVLQRAWTGSFSEQKQFAVDSCTGEWILLLDADEWLTPELGDEIRGLLEYSGEGDRRPKTFELCRSSLFLGKRMRCWKADWVLRLFRRGAAKLDGREVHEAIVPVEGKSGRLAGGLNHEPYTSIEKYVEKLNRYTSLAATTSLAKVPRWVCLLKLVVSPLNMSFRCLVLRGGFLDGVRGLMLSLLSGFYELVKYAKALERGYGS